MHCSWLWFSLKQLGAWLSRKNESLVSLVPKKFEAKVDPENLVETSEKILEEAWGESLPRVEDFLWQVPAKSRQIEAVFWPGGGVIAMGTVTWLQGFVTCPLDFCFQVTSCDRNLSHLFQHRLVSVNQTFGMAMNRL